MAQGFYYDGTAWVAVGIGPPGAQGTGNAQGAQGAQGAMGSTEKTNSTSIFFDSGVVTGNGALGFSNLMQLGGLVRLSGTCWITRAATTSSTLPSFTFITSPNGASGSGVSGTSYTGNAVGGQTAFTAILYADGTPYGSLVTNTTYATSAGTSMVYSYRYIIEQLA